MKTHLVLVVAAVLLLAASSSDADPCNVERTAYCNRLRWYEGLAPCLRRYGLAVPAPSFKDECRRYVDRAITRLPAACQADALAYCAEVEPNRRRLANCLRADRARLSAPCAAALPE